MTEGYEIGTAVRLRAFHVMPDMPPPEGERHAHDYRVEAIVRRRELDERGMVVDLDELRDALEEGAAHVHGRDLDRIRPESTDAVTVEVFARWFHGEVAERVRRAGAEELEIRVWESPDDYGAYGAPLS
ncbi:MAG TPA: 6-carboxytetrahydropterin synthase [Actinomycetota bacterium]|nr:6-carboxytetrahydropterin synthase [Actinomycetota bacterium]